MRPSFPRRWWTRFLQVAIATAALGLYFTLIGRWAMAFTSYGVGLVAAGAAALLLRRREH